MKRVLLAVALALVVSGGGVVLWQLSEQRSHTEIDAHLRAEASTLRNRILSELRVKEALADKAVTAIQSRSTAWASPLTPYPAPFVKDDTTETRWIADRIAALGLQDSLPRHTAFGFLHDQGRSITFAPPNEAAFVVPHRGTGLYKAPGTDRVWLVRPIARSAAVGWRWSSITNGSLTSPYKHMQLWLLWGRRG